MFPKAGTIRESRLTGVQFYGQGKGRSGYAVNSTNAASAVTLSCPSKLAQHVNRKLGEVQSHEQRTYKEKRANSDDSVRKVSRGLAWRTLS